MISKAYLNYLDLHGPLSFPWKQCNDLKNKKVKRLLLLTLK